MYAPSYSHARLYLTDLRYIHSTSVFHECAICESRYVRSIGSLSFLSVLYIASEYRMYSDVPSRIEK